MNNNHQIGTITDIRYVEIGGGMQCEVKVLVNGRDTNWLPKSASVGGAFKMHVPPRVGDQVTVINPNGNNEDGYVTSNIAFEKVPHHKEINGDKIVMWAEDGTTYIHDIKENIITLETPCKVNLSAPVVDVIGVVNIIGSLTLNGVPL